eukprot:763009-Lingulodinium_polyedra.AAC.1
MWHGIYAHAHAGDQEEAPEPPAGGCSLPKDGRRAESHQQCSQQWGGKGSAGEKQHGGATVAAI